MTTEDVDWKHIRSLIPDHFTPHQVMYRLYIKDLYTNDEEFRKKRIETSKKYHQKIARSERVKELAKAYYHKNKERILAQIKERRERAKINLSNN